jgi:hypothetical protein
MIEWFENESLNSSVPDRTEGAIDTAVLTPGFDRELYNQCRQFKFHLEVVDFRMRDHVGYAFQEETIPSYVNLR